MHKQRYLQEHNDTATQREANEKTRAARTVGAARHRDDLTRLHEGSGTGSIATRSPKHGYSNCDNVANDAKPSEWEHQKKMQPVPTRVSGQATSLYRQVGPPRVVFLVVEALPQAPRR